MTWPPRVHAVMHHVHVPRSALIHVPPVAVAGQEEVKFARVKKKSKKLRSKKKKKKKKDKKKDKARKDADAPVASSLAVLQDLPDEDMAEESGLDHGSRRTGGAVAAAAAQRMQQDRAEKQNVSDVLCSWWC